MLCNAAVQKYHNFRIQLDFFIFWQNFCLKPRRREASWLQQKVVQNALATIIFDVWMSFKGVLDTMGSIDSKTVNGMGFLQCLIIGKPILTSTIGIAFWTSSTVHGSWKKKKIKKKIRWGIFRWHQKQRQTKISDFWCMQPWTSVFFEIEDIGRYERGGLASKIWQIEGLWGSTSFQVMTSPCRQFCRNWIGDRRPGPQDPKAYCPLPKGCSPTSPKT